MVKRAAVRKATQPREIWKDGEQQPGMADYELGVDDFSGCGLEHTHNDLGHCWPMTREELVQLWRDIGDLLVG